MRANLGRRVVLVAVRELYFRVYVCERVGVCGVVLCFVEVDCDDSRQGLLAMWIGWTSFYVIALIGTYIPRCGSVEAFDIAERERPLVCVSNGNGKNPRTASLFLRGALERYQSQFQFYWRDASEGGCSRNGRVQNFTSLALVNNMMGRWAVDHPQWLAVKNLCKGKELCIVTGDELCQFPLDWPQREHIILRQCVWGSVAKKKPFSLFSWNYLSTLSWVVLLMMDVCLFFVE